MLRAALKIKMKTGESAETYAPGAFGLVERPAGRDRAWEMPPYYAWSAILMHRRILMIFFDSARNHLEFRGCMEHSFHCPPHSHIGGRANSGQGCDSASTM